MGAKRDLSTSPAKVKYISEDTHFRANKLNHFWCSLPKAFWIWSFYDLSIALYLEQQLASFEHWAVFKGNSDYIGSDLISLIQEWDHKKLLYDLPIKAPLRDQVYCLREGAYLHEILYLLSQDCRTRYAGLCTDLLLIEMIGQRTKTQTNEYISTARVGIFLVNYCNTKKTLTL